MKFIKICFIESMNNPIIITWWAWYLWSHIVVWFMQAWYDVVILDNFSNSDESTIWKIAKIVWKFPDYYNANLKNIEDIEKVFNYYEKIDWVVHLGWCNSINDNMDYVFDYYDTNVLWSINLFKVMQRFKVKKLLYRSSGFIYDCDKWNFPHQETEPANPLSYMATTKFCVESIIKNLAKYFWINSLCLRNFNPIWVDPSGFIGENVFALQHTILYNIIENVIFARNKLKIYGTDYNTPDWTAIRDYVDVTDLANWYLKSYRFLENYIYENKDLIEWVYGILNLWSWKWYSVKDLIAKVEAMSTKKVNYDIVPARHWDVWVCISDSSRASDFLDWKPTVSIENSIKNLWNFIEINKKD